jgi:hypothetical protein
MIETGHTKLRAHTRSDMKPVRFTSHATEQCAERGASESEMRETIGRGVREPTRHGRFLYRHNSQYRALWQGKYYAIKQVAPVVVEADNEIVGYGSLKSGVTDDCSSARRKNRSAR